MTRRSFASRNCASESALSAALAFAASSCALRASSRRSAAPERLRTACSPARTAASRSARVFTAPLLRRAWPSLLIAVASSDHVEFGRSPRPPAEEPLVVEHRLADDDTGIGDLELPDFAAVGAGAHLDDR